MAVNITDDEAVEDRESFYVELTTNDERIEFSRIYQQARVYIYDDDSKTVLYTYRRCSLRNFHVKGILC